MSGNNYDSGLEISYRFAAAVLSTAAVIGRFIGPSGKVGRVRSITALVTTEATTNPTILDVDTIAGITTPAVATVPAQVAALGASSTKAEINASTELPADTVVNLSTNGGAVAGAADITVVVNWF